MLDSLKRNRSNGSPRRTKTRYHRESACFTRNGERHLVPGGSNSVTSGGIVLAEGIRKGTSGCSDQRLEIGPGTDEVRVQLGIVHADRWRVVHPVNTELHAKARQRHELLRCGERLVGVVVRPARAVAQQARADKEHGRDSGFGEHRCGDADRRFVSVVDRQENERRGVGAPASASR